MFPPIEPFATGMLPVSDGNRIFRETSGNPDGKPALTLARRPYSAPSRASSIAFSRSSPCISAGYTPAILPSGSTTKVVG